MSETQQSIFQRPVWVVVFALTAAIAWGWAYPLIKLGFNEWHITQDMTGSKMLFAGIRFAISGLIILAIGRSSHKSFKMATSRDWLYIIAFALLNTTLHYTFFYIGLSHSEGARAAILNSLGTFMLVLLACMAFKSDRLTSSKIVGCVIGFAGILALNIGRRKWHIHVHGRRYDYSQRTLLGICRTDDSWSEPTHRHRSWHRL